jgi:beta-glucosidase
MTDTPHPFLAAGTPVPPPGPHYGATPEDYAPLGDFGPVPEGWVWGVATAAHQIEGGNVNNDWWLFEHTPGSGTAESSADACDSWNRWLEDLQIVKTMGVDAYRFSLEWSRIEPAEGEFSLVALEHYRQILVAAHEMGLKAYVTFHHFTTPQWAADKGGWANPEIVDLFARYVDVTVQHLGDHIDSAATFNEPNIVAFMGYFTGIFPPGIKGDAEGFRAATENLVAAHERARAVLKTGPGDFPVGLTLAVGDLIVYPELDYASGGVRPTKMPTADGDDWFGYLMAGAYYEVARDDDYIGVQTYNTLHMTADGQELPKGEDWRLTQMGWSFTPEALGHTVRQAAAATGVPVIVTENGVATADDADRIEYYSRSLAALRTAMDDGVDVRGFFGWSLLDNFEWAEGYRPQFGFVAVDRLTFERALKPSAAWYGALAKLSRG